MVLFGLLAVAVLNILAGAGFFCVVSHSQQTINQMCSSRTPKLKQTVTPQNQK
jgi:hypothetical protein